MNEDVLKEEIAMLESNNMSLLQENKQLQNNWNELKEFIKENHWGNVSTSILDKMQEIESRK